MNNVIKETTNHVDDSQNRHEPYGNHKHPNRPDMPGNDHRPNMPPERLCCITILVNTVEKQLPEKKVDISYEEVVKLAYGSYDSNTRVVYTVDYFNGPRENEEGHLVKGRSVKVCERMVFTVARSDKS